MGYDISIKQKAIRLRKSGHSIKEIAEILKIAQSSSSLWVRNVTISPSGQKRMLDRKEIKRYRMSLSWEKKREQLTSQYLNLAKTMVNSNPINTSIARFLCSMLFWAEGSKDINHISFTNSDPLMISTFLTLLRTSFAIDESKFRVSVHLHEYHNQQQILKYWSTLTTIPLTQFIKPYLKPHTGVRKKTNYQGCVTIRYYDHKIARELTAIYNALGEKFRGVVQR